MNEPSGEVLHHDHLVTPKASSFFCLALAYESQHVLNSVAAVIAILFNAVYKIHLVPYNLQIQLSALRREFRFLNVS